MVEKVVEKVKYIAICLNKHIDIAYKYTMQVKLPSPSIVSQTLLSAIGAILKVIRPEWYNKLTAIAHRIVALTIDALPKALTVAQTITSVATKFYPPYPCRLPKLSFRALIATLKPIATLIAGFSISRVRGSAVKDPKPSVSYNVFVKPTRPVATYVTMSTSVGVRISS